jgi:hypothetical protein
MCWTECKHKSNVDTCMAYLQSGASYAVGENYDLLLHTHIHHSGKVSHLCRENTELKQPFTEQKYHCRCLWGMQFDML